MKEYNTLKSKQLYQKATEYLVDGVASSFHKASFEKYPICIERAKGSKVYDIDGNEYIDYVAGFGPMLLGYCNDTVNRAVTEQLQKGSHFSAVTQDLFELSKKLTQIIPCAEQVSYQNSGTEANMHAFRLARAFTGKSKIVKFEGQYHGWSDEEKISIDACCPGELGPRNRPYKILHSFGQRPEAADDVIVLPWNDLDALDRTFKCNGSDIAAVITEPFMCDSGPILPKEGYLEGLRKLTEEYETVLIFDEVITGFRLALGGAQQYFSVTPDLSTFAKAIANGFPFAAVVGKKEIMSCGVHASGTFNGNPVGTAAALATIRELEKDRVYNQLHSIGTMLTDGIRKLGKTYGVELYCKALNAICMVNFGTEKPLTDFRDCLNSFDQKTYARFVSQTLKYGVRFTDRRGRIYLSTQHTKEDIEKTLEIIEEVFSKL